MFFLLSRFLCIYCMLFVSVYMDYQLISNSGILFVFCFVYVPNIHLSNNCAQLYIILITCLIIIFSSNSYQFFYTFCCKWHEWDISCCACAVIRQTMRYLVLRMRSYQTNDEISRVTHAQLSDKQWNILQPRYALFWYYSSRRCWGEQNKSFLAIEALITHTDWIIINKHVARRFKLYTSSGF